LEESSLKRPKPSPHNGVKQSPYSSQENNIQTFTITQFSGIAPLIAEGKMFFSVVAKQVTNYLLSTKYIDTSSKKAGIPEFPSCVENSTMI